MLSFDPRNNTKRQNHRLLIGSVIPRPIAFVTSVAKDGTINGAPFSYFNIVSSNPPMLSLSIQRRDGVMKDTAINILERKEFVIHIVDEQNVEKVNTTSAFLPPNKSEIEQASLTLIESEHVSVPGISEAKVRYECILKHSFKLGDEHSIGTDFLIGKVIRFHVEEDIYESGRINYDALGAVSRLAGSDYAKIGEVFSLDRPK